MRKKLEHSIKAVVQDGKAISGKDAVPGKHACLPALQTCAPAPSQWQSSQQQQQQLLLLPFRCAEGLHMCLLLLRVLLCVASASPNLLLPLPFTCSGGAAHLRPPLPQIHGQGKQLALRNCTTVQRLGCLHACPPLPLLPPNSTVHASCGPALCAAGYTMLRPSL